MASWLWSIIFAALLFVNVNGQSFADAEPALLERLEFVGREPRIAERKRTRQNLDRVLKKPVFNFAYLFRQKR
ncbi:unnamed protein product, partial [Mesorhabditis belari]|uniref:Uncharacterized protein n=1 Tax=Mesorhabditis belari TaxID=2138241 RepID=A0AAF3ERN4_9BILA